MSELTRDGTAATRYAFELCDVLKLDDGTPNFVTIRQIDVDPTVLGFDALTAGLRAWALNVLREERNEVGLYYAGFATLDEDGVPERPVHQLYLAWSGAEELSLAG